MVRKKATIGIIGLGRFGMSLAIELATSGKNIVCIDKDEKKIKEYEEISRINSSYWSDYEDSIREVRGLDKDCTIF